VLLEVRQHVSNRVGRAGEPQDMSLSVIVRDIIDVDIWGVHTPAMLDRRTHFLAGLNDFPPAIVTEELCQRCRVQTSNA
jgi:hypothetical protein